MAFPRPLHTLKTAGSYWVEDNASQMGAALAYYSLFSLAPLLIIAIAVAGLVYGEAAARGQVVARIGDFIGPDSAAVVQTMLEGFHHGPAEGPWAALIGLGSLWYGAISIFTQLRSSLNRVWRVPAPTQRVVVGVVKDYLIAFLMVLVSSAFVLALLTASAILPVLIRWSSTVVPDSHWTFPLADFAVSSCLIALMFAATYRFMSDGHVRYHQVWGGAFVAAMLFTVGKMLIGYYLANTLLASAYGAAGSLVVFLVWVYYSAQIFFFGAEIIRVELGK